jgi:hypothetical protein
MMRCRATAKDPQSYPSPDEVRPLCDVGEALGDLDDEEPEDVRWLSAPDKVPEASDEPWGSFTSMCSTTSTRAASPIASPERARARW